jgi:alpha-ketoglutarate-dependent taurine dioxygenase
MIVEKNKFAAIVTECDYENDADKIRELIGDCRVVVVRNNDPVPPETLVSFYKTIGEVVSQNTKVKGNVAGHGELIKVRKNGLFSGEEDGELEWHSAGMNRKGHDDVVVMYMHQNAESGGNTFFSDSQTAFADLDDNTKDILRNIKSKIVTYNAKLKLEQMYYKRIFSDEQTMMEFKDIDGQNSFEKQTPRKDLVTTHPINNKEGLYFPWTVIRGFSGISKDAQHNLYYKLKKHTQDEKYVYEHEWNNYDICFSDQHHSLHKREAYTGDRELWRAGIWYRDEEVKEKVDETIEYRDNQAGSYDEWSCESLIK